MAPDFEVDPGCTGRADRSHGSLWAYRANGCRCPESWEKANAARRRRYRSRRLRAGLTYEPRQWLPGQDVDPIAVRRAIQGAELPRLTRGECTAVVAALTEAGMTSKEIAAHLRITDRTVCRHRRYAREVSQ